MATAIARWIKPVCFPNLGFHRLFSCRSCRMLTLNRNIRKSFGSSSECLWNVIQKWRTDLCQSSIARKEKEPAANILWPLVHYYVFLAVSIISHFSPPYPPLVCAILPWNCSYRQFLFSCIFLTIILLVLKMPRKNCGCAGSLTAPRFFRFSKFCHPEP